MELELPKIYKLEGEGETFITNKVKLTTTIFNSKGWNKPEHLSKRLDKYVLFMRNQAITDFHICMKKAKEEFLVYTQIKDLTRMADLKTKQEDFLKWLKEAKTLTRLGYIPNDCDASGVKKAFVKAVNDYKRAIEYHMGKQLWKDHRHAFREHKKYFCNQLTKPFAMSIVNFNNRMREYGELLRHLPPPSTRRCTHSSQARWDEVILTEGEIRRAIFDALPHDYQIHIKYNQVEDWQEMSDQEFLDVMVSFERLDQARRIQKETEEAQKKMLSAARFMRVDRKGKPVKVEKPAKRPHEKMSSETKHPSPKSKKFCQHCKENNRKWWTHNTEECYFKKARRENNAMEAVHSEIDELKGLIKGLQKKMDSDSE